jgi:pSer/pThr/pTyr-binding forkhead associated (FHA) protein
MNRFDGDSPIIIGQTGPLNGQRWVLNTDITVGRDDACELVIPDRQVSRFHARFVLNSESVVLEDLSSKNGTYCNGVKVDEPLTLQDGDSIQIALVQYFVYLSSDSTLPLGGGITLDDPQAAQASLERKLFLDKLSRRVWIDQQEVLPPLSVPQFRLLEAIYDRQGSVVPRQELVIAVWGDKEAIGVSEQALDALVRRLRDRLAVLDPNHVYLVTVRGYGLRLDNPDNPSI